MKEALLANPAIGALSQVVQQQVVEWYGPKARLASNTPGIVVRPYSIFLRYGISMETEDGISKFILLKIVRRPEMENFDEIIANDLLRTEGLASFQSSLRLYELKTAFPQKPIFAILPLAYLEAWNAIVMEEAQQIRELKPIIGTMFNSPVSLRQADWQAHKPLVRKVGDWLKLFHDYEHNTDIVDSAKQFQLAVSAESEKWQESGGLPDQIIEMLDELQPHLAGRNTKITQVHGDLTLVNVIVEEGGDVGGIDPHSRRLDSIYVDLAHFIVDPLLQKWQVFSGGVLLNRNRYREYRALILDGYFGNDKPDYQALYGYACLEFLKKWRLNEEKLLNDNSNPILWKIFNGVNRWYFLRKITLYWRRAIATV